MSSLGALLYILVYILSISFYFVKELHCVTYRDQLTMFPITSKTIRSCQTEEEILFYKPIPNKTLTSKDLTASPVSLYELTKLLNTVIPCELRIMRGNFGSLHHDMALKKNNKKKKHQCLWSITHNVHRSAALSDTICVDDVHHPAQHPGV